VSNAAISARDPKTDGYPHTVATISGVIPATTVELRAAAQNASDHSGPLNGFSDVSIRSNSQPSATSNVPVGHFSSAPGPARNRP